MKETKKIDAVILGKKRKVTVGKAGYIYVQARRVFLAVAVLVGVLFAINGMTHGALANRILYDAELVKVTVESDDTYWGLTEKLNPELTTSQINDLVQSAIKAESSLSHYGKDLNNLKAGDSVYVYCNNKIAKELGLK